MRFVLVGAFFAIFSVTYGNSSSAKKSPYNITGKWFLPNLNSPVFYLHFRDSISWIEADAVCQFHHSQLVTVNTVTQYEDMKSYLKELYYDEPVWIGLRRTVTKGPFKWTDESPLSTDEYWKEFPINEEKLCVISSPVDNYHWIARECNGPDVASFICEMSIPKWVRKSACLDSLNPSVTITFHPEKSMIKVGKVCQNTDVKYIECHDPQGKEDKFKENLKMMKEHLICQSWPKEKTESSILSSTVNTTTNVVGVSSPVTMVQSSTFSPKKEISSTFPTTLNTNNFTHYNISTNMEFYEKNALLVENDSELSTVSYPQEMSFAEEPIKASKPFIIKEPTDSPRKFHVATETSQSISNINLRNKIPTVLPTKIKIDKASIPTTEIVKESTNVSSYASSTIVAILLNTTPIEESHEIFNSDRDDEMFQDPAVVKKQMKIEIEENDGNNPTKTILSKSSESEEEHISDRTYNIEGTFDSNDFMNPDPINLYKKIDLTPLESVTKNTVTISDQANKVVTNAPNKLQSNLTSSTIDDFTFAFNISLLNNQTVTANNEIITQNETISTERLEPQPKKSSLLSGAEDNENERNLRKRNFTNSKRRSFYRYFLGRILG